MDRYEKDSLILPSAFSALAFEHVNQIAAQRIHNHSDDCEFLAATAGRVGPIFDRAIFSARNISIVAMVASSQVRWREMLMLPVPTSLNLIILNNRGGDHDNQHHASASS
jgi:hypothetical protein